MRGRTTAALALLLALTGCAGTDEPDDLPSGGPVDDAVEVEPEHAPLDWQDTGVAVDTRYVRGPEWEAIGDASDTEVLASAPVREWFADWLQRLNREASGNASRLEWIALLDEPASIDRGEITDKGSINQRAVLQWRADQVEALYRGLDPAILRAGARL